MQIPAARCRVSVGCVVLWCCLMLISSASGSGVKGRSKSAKGITARTLVPLLKSKSEQLWEKGLAGVTSESLEDAQVVQAIAEFAGRESSAERFSPSLVRAIALLTEANQPQAGETLATLLNATDFRVVMITADHVSLAEKPDLLEPLMKLPERTEFPMHYGFRRCVVDAVARYRDKSAIDFLLRRLEDSDGQLKYEVAMSLQRATGQGFGGKAGDWRTWWRSNRNEFQFVSRIATSQSVAFKSPPQQIPWDEPRPSFYGMTIYAKRVVFVIDRSGSMKSAVDGESRLARAQQELQKAIKALSERDYFNVVAFDDRMEVFQSKLVLASEDNKHDGIRFGYGLEPRGGTACYEPLKMGLAASNDLELILFLSDGEPTAGALIDPSAIVAAITNHNLLQRTTINTLGIDARDNHEEFLKNLAEKNLGKLLLIR